MSASKFNLQEIVALRQLDQSLKVPSGSRRTFRLAKLLPGRLRMPARWNKQRNLSVLLLRRATTGREAQMNSKIREASGGDVAIASEQP
jgi:hypothetical protein